MTGYVVRRLLALVPVLLIVATVGFFLVYLTAGDLAAVMLGPDATQEDLANLRRIMGLDRPLLVREAMDQLLAKEPR